MKVLYDKKRNQVLIPTDWIMPKGISREERNNVWNMPYPERIKAYATKEHQKEIYEVLNLHPDAKLTEYCNAY